MAGVFCLSYATGRRMRPGDLLALACVIVLVWRPADLFNSGFQLSFGVVAALMRFTGPLGQAIWPDPPVIPAGDRTRYTLVRRGVDYLAVNIVAYAVAMPLVMYHFCVLTSLTILLSIVALPVVTVVLAVGYLKVLVGAALPSVGLLLAGPLQWLADIMSGLVDHAAGWRASTIEPTRQPTVVWTGVVLVVVIAWLSGAFVRRRRAMVAAIAVCVVDFALLPGIGRLPAMRINMFAVGNGSCYLVRLHEGEETFTLMFDCGSQQYLGVGSASIVPALRAVGVDRIDLMIISHADMDHYSGSLDVMKSVPVARVVVTPQHLAAAQRRPDTAAAHLVESIRRSEVSIDTASRGWRMQAAGARLRMLWPPADFVADRANNASLVLSVQTAGRLLLLNGDIQQTPIEALMRTESDLRADICDLPHHGSFLPASPEWLRRVDPSHVLQSSGARRRRIDHWAKLTDRANMTRLITDRDGMVQLDVADDGQISWRRFRPNDE